MKNENFKNYQLDMLKELSNIGSGNALISLAKLVNTSINMEVPSVNILQFKDVAELMGGAENPVVGILLDITGDIKGSIMFMFEEQYAFSLVSILRKRQVKEISELTEIDISALKEVGNILAGSYLTALSTLCNLDLLPSTPHFAYDMAGAILSIPAIEFGQMSDEILYIETLIGEGKSSVQGKFFLIPDSSSYDTLLNALGVKLK